MTVSSEVNHSGPYIGNGVTKSFVYDFRIISNAHLSVVLTEGDTSTVLILNNQYSVFGAGDAGGGTVLLVNAPTAGQTITILRKLPFTQDTELENQGPFFAETIEAALDRAVMRDQQLQEQVDRAVLIPVGSDTAELSRLISKILRLYESVDNIDTLAVIDTEIANVSTVASSIPAVAAVANQVAQLAPIVVPITQVAAIRAAVTTVAGIADSVTLYSDVYQGAKAADPTARNSGAALMAGDMYFNTSINQLKLYTGSAWLGLPGAGDMLATNNLSEVNPEAARGNLRVLTPPQGRLTLTSGTPYPMASVAAAAMLFYTTAVGNLLPIYDGAKLTLAEFTELSQSTTDATKAPAAMGPYEVHDVFGWKDGATLRLSRQRWSKTATVTITIANPAVVSWPGHGLKQGAPFIPTTTGALPTGLVPGTIYFVGPNPGANSFNLCTSPGNAVLGNLIATSGSQSGVHTGENRTTSRGYGFVSVRGILLNATAITNGPGAQRGTWLGTVATNGSGTLDMNFGGAAAGGLAAALMVWNAYNRVTQGPMVRDTAAQYNYSGANPTQANQSLGNQIAFVTGGYQDIISAHAQIGVQTANTALAKAMIGIGLNSTTTFEGAPGYVVAATASSLGFIASANSSVVLNPPLGLNVISANICADGTAQIFNRSDAQLALSAVLAN